MAVGLDIAIVLVLAIGTLRGFRRGFIREAFGIVGCILAVILALQTYTEVSLLLMERYGWESWQAQSAAFLGIAALTAAAALLVGSIWSALVRLTPLAVVDRIAGASFGLAKTLIIVLVLLLMLGSLGVPPIDDTLAQSRLSQQFRLLVPVLYERLEMLWPESLAGDFWRWRHV